LLSILLFGATAIFFPLGLYCFFLARVNRRACPLMVFGVWDFAGTLFAVSGFLLFLGPSFLTGFTYQWRELWLQLNYRSLRGLGESWSSRWLMYWYVYFGLVIAGSGLLLWQRRLVTAVYNIDPPVLDGALARVLDSLGLQWTRAGNRVLVAFRQDPVVPAGGRLLRAIRRTTVGRFLESTGFDPDETEPATAATATNGEQQAATQFRLLTRINPFHPLRHVTLHWPSDVRGLRWTIEKELCREFENIRTGSNPAGHWFLWLSAFILLTLFVFTTSLQFLILRAQ
jgi:hypothetical protein